MGVEPGLEAVQGVSHHNPLRQTFPVWYISREERDLPVLCLAGGDVIAVVIVLSVVNVVSVCLFFPTGLMYGDYTVVNVASIWPFTILP